MKNNIESARLDIKDLLPIGLTMIVTGIIISFGAQVTGEIRSEQCETGVYNTTGGGYCQVDATNSTAVDGGYGFNISSKSLEGTYNLTKKLPTIGTVAAIVIVIGLLLSGFAYMMGNR